MEKEEKLQKKAKVLLVKYRRTNKTEMAKEFDKVLKQLCQVINVDRGEYLITNNFLRNL